VVGAGMIGLSLVQALRASGCGRIFAVDVDADRLGLARQLGWSGSSNNAICRAPTRQGTHLPQDSDCVNPRK
jgi:threonine dehydrogenase-like Zn-dependent dehydrogenase